MSKTQAIFSVRRMPALALSFGLAALAGLPVQASDVPGLVASPGQLGIERPLAAGAAQLKVLAPDGRLHTIDFAHGEPVQLTPAWVERQGLVPGQYVFEVQFAPLAGTETRAGLAGNEDQEDGHSSVALMPRSGTFKVTAEGSLLVTTAAPEDESHDSAGGEGRAAHVFDGDAVIRNSLCVGVDCLNNESFGFDTFKLKENNLRLSFIDTSSTGTFAAGDWQLRANDSDSAGADHFSIDWLGTEATSGGSPVTTPFRVDGTAPTNAIRISSTGRVGFRTATPAQDLHVATSNTPGIRLEQTNAGGFSPQTWDLAGNEANFFIRDVTNGSLLPFRIRPGAPSSSIDIAASGNVGIGIAAPAAKLHVAGGDLRVDGSVYQLSSRALKTDFVRFDPARLLDLVGQLDLGLWRYLHAPGGGPHFGPAAEDFHAAFGLGDTDDSISLADMAGVALGAAQALKRELDERDARIEDLTARLERLERALQAQASGAEQ